MHHLIKTTLAGLTIENLQSYNLKNDLYLAEEDIMLFHQLLSQEWSQIIDEEDLSLKEDALKIYFDSMTIAKYRELLTLLIRNILFNRHS